MNLPEQSQQNPISIVIPTYNRIKTLKKVANSYLTQSQVREIIIVDDAGTDNTEEFVAALCQEDPRVVYVRNKANMGLPATRNVGVSHASGSFIVFGEDDLYFGSDYAAKLMACLERNGGSIAAGRILFPFPGEIEAEALARTSIPVSQRLDKHRIMFDASSPAADDIEAPFVHACSMVRRDVFDVIQYDPEFKGNAYREETDFYLRARQHGHKIFYCPQALCVHLPREVQRLGGVMAKGIWIYKYWSVRNNYRFLRRHYGYLKEQHLVEHGFVRLMVSFIVAELMKIPTFYLRKFSPAAYTVLAKHLSK